MVFISLSLWCVDPVWAQEKYLTSSEEKEPDLSKKPEHKKNTVHQVNALPLPMDVAAMPYGLNEPHESFERKLNAWAVIGLSVPMVVWGLVGVGKAYRDPTDRASAAKEGGAGAIAGAALAAQGVIALREEQRRKKRAAQQKKRERVWIDPPISYDRTLLLLQHDAERSRDVRDQAGNMVMMLGILAGGMIGAIPLADHKIDRWSFVVAGLGLAATSAGTGIWLWSSDSSEEQLYKNALKQR